MKRLPRLPRGFGVGNGYGYRFGFGVGNGYGYWYGNGYGLYPRSWSRRTS